MTMQAEPGPSRSFAFSPNDVRPDLINRFRKGFTPFPKKLAWSGLDDLALLREAGFSFPTKSGSNPEISAEGLLLFGTENAISKAFPFLETTFLLRKKERRLHESIRLPLNLVDCVEALRGYAHEQTWPEIRARTSNHASLHRLVLDQWIWEMAISRDYAQVKPARFGCDPELFFLEYPKIQPNLDGETSHPPQLVSQSHLLTLGLHCLLPTMQAFDATRLPQQEYDLFGISPLRLDGRFLRISAIYPPFLAPSAPANHVKYAARTPKRVPLSPPHGFSTMQASSHKVGSSPKTTLPKPGIALANTELKNRALRPSRASKQVNQILRHEGAPTPTPHPKLPESDMSDRTNRILAFCASARYRTEIQNHVGIKNRDHFRKGVLNRLIDQGLIRLTLPDKPNSPKQQYVTVTKIGSH
jgi:hypothetical protein